MSENSNGTVLPGAGRLVLVSDDEPNIRDLLTLVLEEEGYSVVSAASGEEALAAFRKYSDRIVLIIQDLKLPDLDGARLLARYTTEAPEIPVVVITAFSTSNNAVEAMRLGAYDYIRKPFEVDAIRDVVNRAVGKSSGRKNPAKGQGDASSRKYELIGNHSSIQRVMDLVNRVAPTDSTVLIQGESGTGKELVARALHDRSSRQDGVFISVNCSAFTETLLESELFGHKKGSFTGAVADSDGFFRAADGGTLFLDEIADMSLTTQVKILRVIEERIVTPVGSTRGEAVDVRIVAATNKNIREQIEQGSFREDLYYRLNVIPVELPPLRDRKEDIPLLAGYFIRKHAEKMGKELTGISEASIEKLRGYEWPGNVRELDNIIQRHVALCVGRELDSIQLRDHGQEPLVPAAAGAQTRDFGIPDRGMDLEDRLEEIETGYLREALNSTGGNMTEAARLLGMSYRSMRYRVQKLRVRDVEPVV